MPFFHDAYKGWSCCNKKSVDFTEFLNIKGCKQSKHSNIKPAEPPKSEKSPTIEAASAEIVAPAATVAPAAKPAAPSTIVRPDFDAPLVQITPTVAPSLQQAIDNIVPIISRSSDLTQQPIG